MTQAFRSLQKTSVDFSGSSEGFRVTFWNSRKVLKVLQNLFYRNFCKLSANINRKLLKNIKYRKLKQNILLYHFVICLCLAGSFFSGGSYISKVGIILMIEVDSCAPETYSTPPNFHSPDELTKTDQMLTLLCLKLPSLFKKDKALYKYDTLSVELSKLNKWILQLFEIYPMPRINPFVDFVFLKTVNEYVTVQRIR